MSRDRGVVIRVFMAIVLMAMLMPFVLWLPIAGPIGAGFVGGIVARSAGLAALAVLLLSTLPVAISALVGYAGTGYVLVGAGIGAVTVVMIFTMLGPLTLGALIGGFLSGSGPRMKAGVANVKFPWKAR